MRAETTILIVSVCAFLLMLVKLAVAIISGSVVILASALDSLFDTMFSGFNLFAVKKSKSPSNKDFNYGFGKIEALASLFEGVVIFASGLYIIYKSIANYISGAQISYLNESIIVMIISICATFGLVLLLKYTLKKTTNLILEAEILHYKVDLLSNLGIIFSLLIINISGILWLDSVIGALIGGYICFSSYKIAKKGFEMLLDRAIDEALLLKIKSILDSAPITSYHDFKSRISGNVIFLEAHLVFSDTITLLNAHSISDSIENSIKELDSSYRWVIIMHLDPYNDSV